MQSATLIHPLIYHISCILIIAYQWNLNMAVRNVPCFSFNRRCFVRLYANNQQVVKTNPKPADVMAHGLFPTNSNKIIWF